MMASLGCHYETMLRNSSKENSSLYIESDQIRNFQTFRSLLEAGANVSAKNSIGKTAAMLCGFVGLKHAHRPRILNFLRKYSHSNREHIPRE